MNCSATEYPPLSRLLIKFMYNILLNFQLKVSHSYINIFAIKPNELGMRILSYFNSSINNKSLSTLWLSIKPVFCSLLHYGHTCMEQVAKSRINTMDQIEANSIWPENSEDLIFYNCQRSNAKRNISIASARKHFLVSYLTQQEILDFNLSPSCVTLFQIYAPLYIGLYTNNQSFRRELVHFTYRYLHDNMPQNIGNVSTVTILHILEILSLNLHSNFCYELQHYSGPFRNNYILMSQWKTFKSSISCYLYPILCIFGICSNAIVFCNYAIKIKRKKWLLSYADFTFISFVDILLVAILTMPPILKCWRSGLFFHSEWFCSGQSFVRGVLHTISSWSVAIMGLNLVTCSIETNMSQESKKHVYVLKHVAVFIVAVTLNLPKLFYIRVVNRAGLFSMCYHIRMGWITPSEAQIFYSALYAPVPFIICMIKNVFLLIKNSSFLQSNKQVFFRQNSTVQNVIRQNRTYFTTVLAVCVRFALFSLPSLLSFVLKTATPHRYLKNVLFDSTEKVIYFYIPTITQIFVVLNFSINLYVLLLVRRDIKIRIFR